jgi:hypothetical protein
MAAATAADEGTIRSATIGLGLRAEPRGIVPLEDLRVTDIGYLVVGCEK